MALPPTVLPPEVSRAAERSAAPGPVAAALARIGESRPGDLERLDTDARLGEAVVAVVAASRSMARLVETEPAALDVLACLEQGVLPPDPDGDAWALVRWKRLAWLRVAARDLLGLDPLEVVGGALAEITDAVLSSAWRLAGTAASSIAVIGMGKLGGRELNYASDIDVVFVGAGDVLGLFGTARRCFRVDTSLRPEGRDGPLVRSLASYEAYWERWARTWEFQALLKARPVAGDGELGALFAAHAAAHVWARPFQADEIREVRVMKSRAEGEVERRGLSEREVKRGRGGIRDIEFAVQLLQLVHGRHDPALRSPNTLVALAELAHAGYVASTDAGALADAYRFLRRVEHCLQLHDEAQVHAVPTEPEALDHLARVLGFRDSAPATAVAAFRGELARHQVTVRSIHERLFFRPLLESFSSFGGAGLSAGRAGLSDAAAAERMEAFGFADAAHTRSALQELTHGFTRRSRMMQQLLPLVLSWLSESPDPDAGLLGLRALFSKPHVAGGLVAMFRDSPDTAQRLCALLGTSRRLASAIEHGSDVVSELSRPEGPERRDRAQLVSLVRSTVEWRAGGAARLGALRRLRESEELRIAVRDVLGEDDVSDVAAALTDLAEAVLEEVVALVSPPVPMAVIAMGRFGGAELSYASDLDVLVAIEADSRALVQAGEEAAEDLVRVVKGRTPAERLYALDVALRPEGKQGLLARTLAGYQVYWERRARTWERQALLKARPVAGDAALAARFMEQASGFVWRGLSESDEREIRRMKARVERERIPPGEDPDFHLKLGRGGLADVEWTVQLLQLRHGVRAPGTIAALELLEAAGGIGAQDAAALAEAYRFCERARNRLFLQRGAVGDALPTQPEQLAPLARSLGWSPAELREAYRRVTRRAREVTEQLFYGR